MTNAEGVAAAAPPAHVQLIQMCAGGWVAAAVYAAAKLGIADHLADGFDVASAGSWERIGCLEEAAVAACDDAVCASSYDLFVNAGLIGGGKCDEVIAPPPVEEEPPCGCGGGGEAALLLLAGLRRRR